MADPSSLRPADSADALTGLPGRAAFHAELAARFRGERDCAVIVIDIDSFGAFDRARGSDGGDAMLKSLATRLPAAVGPDCFAARVDGDEFAFIVGETDPARLLELGQACMATVRASVPESGGLGLTASIGMAAAPADADEAWALVHAAHVAQFVAKSTGGNRALSAKPTLSAQIEKSVREGIAMGGFSLNYQPIVSLAPDGRLCGFEAFLRWHHPTRGLIFPADFRAVLEEPRAARAIGSEALTQAVYQLRRWKDAGVEVGGVSLNVSMVQLRDGDFAGEVLERLKARSVPGSRLTLELPEDIYLTPDLVPIRASLDRLVEAGVRLAVDGWAQGALAFEDLKRLPIEEMKLDRAFVSAADPAQLRAIVDSARGVSLSVTAEGVETADQAAMLAAVGCGRAQGWYFGRPMPSAKVPVFVTKYADGGARKAA